MIKYVIKPAVESLTKKKLEVPTAQEVTVLQEAGTYDAYKELKEFQNCELLKHVGKIIIPAAVSAVSIGIMVTEYVILRNNNSKYYDAGKTMITEATANSKVKK